METLIAHPIATPSAPAPGLTTEQMRLIADASIRTKKIRRAAGVAAASGWTMLTFAGITLVGALFGDLSSLVFGVLLGLLAWNEIVSGQKLRTFRVGSAKRLGCNQLALGVLIVSYAAYSLYAALHDPAMAQLSGATGDAGMDASLKQLGNMITYGLYGGIAAIGIVAPGLTALYYFTREALVGRIVSQTPAWVLEALRAAA